MLKLIDINKTYENKKVSTQALKNINLEIEDKGLISIVGVSGCGKTTLLNLIGGLDTDYQGSVEFENTETKHYRKKEWDDYRNKNVGFIFQDYNLINNISVYDNINIALSLQSISKKQAKQLIVDISKRLQIENILYKKPTELSGGQKQRVALARALIKKPKIILADEPTGALDSKTSEEIMKIIKELSNETLVIMVTHNEKIANQYSDRIISMLDGNITEDIKINEISKNKPKNIGIKKKYPLQSLLKLSFSNLYNKLLRSLLTILACSIGIVALCLVITVASGMNLYINDVQEQALKTYPITITSVVDDEEPEKEEIVYDKYPNDDTIHIVDYEISYDGHVNTFTTEFMDHIRNMDEDLYTGSIFTGWVRTRLLSKVNNNHTWVSGYSYLKELNYNYNYINTEYDVLEGHLPTNKNELVLVIDEKNCINRNVLNYLGLYYDDLKEIKFSDIIGTKYKLITNDLYYVKKDNKYVTYNKTGTIINELYEKASIELEIAGIIRQKPTAKTKMYGTCLLYSPLLTDFMLENNNNSQIVIDQKANPDINVLTGEKFQHIEEDTYTQTIQYQYEKNLTDFGANYNVTKILIYTDKLENFEKIHDYIDIYNQDKVSVSQIKYTDYLKNMVDEFDLFIKVLTQVLLIFALISLLVASIMIVVVTYVSVLEKTKQVGILRSIGMSQGNILNLFIFENLIIGLLSGLLGVIVGTILINPVLSIIIDVMKEAEMTVFSVENLEMSGFNMSHLLLLVVGSIILTVISGIIPSIVASKKDPVKALNQ